MAKGEEKQKRRRRRRKNVGSGSNGEAENPPVLENEQVAEDAPGDPPEETLGGDGDDGADSPPAASGSVPVEPLPEEIRGGEDLFRIVMLEERLEKFATQRGAKDHEYNDRLLALRRERTSVLKQLDKEIRDTTSKISDRRLAFEEKHGINMNEYSYDDETGMMTRLPDEIIEQIHEFEEAKKKKDGEKVADSRDQGESEPKNSV